MKIQSLLVQVPPIYRLLSVLFLCAVLAGIFSGLALQQPEPSVSLREGQKIISQEAEFVFEANDWISEPGDLPTHAEQNRFIERQNEIFQILKSDSLQLVSADNVTNFEVRTRHLGDLPWGFWAQLIVGLGGILIAGWIWSIKASEPGPVFFFLSGLAMGLSALASAVYTTRSSALSSDIYFPLYIVNGFGAAGFGIFMTGLFLVYPKRTRWWKGLSTFVATVFTLWFFLVIAQWIPKVIGLNAIILSLLILIFAAVGYQFYITRGDAKSRAALTWLGLSVLVGSSGWVLVNTVPLLLGQEPLDQSYAFFSFLVIYLGFAAGLAQYRLFEVGQWAYRFFYYAVGAVVIGVLDAILIYVGMGRFPALGLSLMLVGFVYLPFRDILWRRWNRKKELNSSELLENALHVAFAPSTGQRTERWQTLLTRLYDPLEMTPVEVNTNDVILSSDGTEMTVPSVAGASSLKLSYPFAGRSLYNWNSLETARSLVALISQAESNREAYDRGVGEERLRIAQDLHDNVGARLLTGLHSEKESDVKATIRDAISDIRIIVKGVSGEGMPLVDMMADLRVDTVSRLQAVGIKLQWPFESYKDSKLQLSYALYKTVDSCFKELVSNVIKHSQATDFTVRISVKGDHLIIEAEDNGVGAQHKQLEQSQGFGMKSLQKRIQRHQGSLLIEPQNPGLLTKISLPLS